MRYRLRLAIISGLTASLALAGCGSDDSSSTASDEPSSTASSTDEASADEGSEDAVSAEVLAAYEALTQTPTELEAERFGPVEAPDSIDLFFISCPQTIAGCLTGVTNIEAAADAAGYPITVCDVPTGTPEEFQRCMDQALQAQPDYIINNSTPPEQAPQAYAQAHEDGIPIVGQFSGFEPDPENGNTLEAGFMSDILGAAVGTAIIAESGGNAKILQMKDTIYPHSEHFARGLAEEIAANCPNCELKDVEYQASNIQTSVPGLIQTTLQTNQDYNWFFTGAVAFTGVLAADAARQLGTEDDLTVVGFNAEPANVALLKKCDVEKYDIAIGTPEISWVALDLIIRHAAGAPVEGGIENPTYKLLTCDDAEAYPGPEGYEQTYLNLWGLS